MNCNSVSNRQIWPEGTSLQDRQQIKAIDELKQRLNAVETLYANAYAKITALEKVITKTRMFNSSNEHQVD